MIISKLKNCIEKRVDFHRRKYNYGWNLITELAKLDPKDDSGSFKYKENNFTFELIRTSDFDFNQPTNLEVRNSEGHNIEKFQFERADFIDLLIKNIEKIST